jgi:hypothetical protein
MRDELPKLAVGVAGRHPAGAAAGQAGRRLRAARAARRRARGHGRRGAEGLHPNPNPNPISTPNPNPNPNLNPNPNPNSNPNPNPNQVQRAYKLLAMQHHPDRGGSEERFKDLSRAYKRLSSEGDSGAEYAEAEEHDELSGWRTIKMPFTAFRDFRFHEFSETVAHILILLLTLTLTPTLALALALTLARALALTLALTLTLTLTLALALALALALTLTRWRTFTSCCGTRSRGPLRSSSAASRRAGARRARYLPPASMVP